MRKRVIAQNPRSVVARDDTRGCFDLQSRKKDLLNPTKNFLEIMKIVTAFKENIFRCPILVVHHFHILISDRIYVPLIGSCVGPCRPKTHGYYIRCNSLRCSENPVVRFSFRYCNKKSCRVRRRVMNSVYIGTYGQNRMEGIAWGHLLRNIHYIYEPKHGWQWLLGYCRKNLRRKTYICCCHHTYFSKN